MIKGAKYWNKRSFYYVQTNNPTETFLKDVEYRDWLESCGPTAAVNCLAVIGHDITIRCPGTYKPQPEEVLFDYFNDPANEAKLNKIRELDGIPKNRVPQYYPLALEEVFNAYAEFSWHHSFDVVATRVYNGDAVMACFKNPGHYIAIVAYDDKNDNVILNDPWPGKWEDGNGFNKTISRDDYPELFQPFIITFRSVSV